LVNEWQDKNELHQVLAILDQMKDRITSRKSDQWCNGYSHMEFVLLF